MSVRENLIAAKDQFRRYGGRSIHAAFLGACRNAPDALDTLAALRSALPDGYRDFSDFESSRLWRAKDAYRVFDRAIAAQPEGEAP